MSNPLFSIIVPVYKVEKFLDECVERILGQTYSDFELILIDDGSPDTCPQMCDEYAKADNRVRVLHIPNSGVSKARAKGASMAVGSYLILCDSDDYFDLRTLETVKHIIDEYQPDEIVFNMTYKQDSFKVLNTGKYYSRAKMEQEIFPYLLEDAKGKYFAPCVWGGVFKKELYIENQVADHKIEIGEDLACKKAVTYNAKSLYLMDDILYYYRTNMQSATKSNKVFPWNGPELIGKHLESKINMESFDMREQLDRVITHQLFLVVKSQFNRNESYWSIRKDITKNIKKKYYQDAIKNCKYSFSYYKGMIAKLCLRYRFIGFMFIFNRLGL